jgi:integrase
MLSIIESSIARGTFEPKPRSAATLGEVLDRYEKIRREKAGDARFNENDRYYLDRIRIAFDLSRPAAEITVEDAERYVAREFAGRSTSTQRYQLAILHAAILAAFRAGILDSDPLARLKLPRPKNLRTTIWTEEELDRVMMRLAPWCQQVVAIARLTLLRQSDVLALRWEDVRGGYLHPRVKKSKRQGRPRKVSPELRAALPPRGTSPWLFPSERGEGPRTRHEFKSRWQRAVQLAGFAPIRVAASKGKPAKYGPPTRNFHDLRRTGATAALNAGLSEAIVADMLDHSDTRTVHRYAHVQQEAADAAFELIAKRLPVSNGKLKRQKRAQVAVFPTPKP